GEPPEGGQSCATSPTLNASSQLSGSDAAAADAADGRSRRAPRAVCASTECQQGVVPSVSSRTVNNGAREQAECTHRERREAPDVHRKRELRNPNGQATPP